MLNATSWRSYLAIKAAKGRKRSSGTGDGRFQLYSRYGYFDSCSVYGVKLVLLWTVTCCPVWKSA